MFTSSAAWSRSGKAGAVPGFSGRVGRGRHKGTHGEDLVEGHWDRSEGQHAIKLSHTVVPRKE